MKKLVTIAIGFAACATSALGQGFPGVARPDRGDSAATAPKTPHHPRTFGAEVYGKPYEGFRAFARTVGCDSAQVEAVIALADTADALDPRYRTIHLGAGPCELLYTRGTPEKSRHITTGEIRTWIWSYSNGSVYGFRWNGHSWVLTDMDEGG